MDVNFDRHRRGLYISNQDNVASTSFQDGITIKIHEHTKEPKSLKMLCYFQMLLKRKEAMNEEIKSINQDYRWTLAELPPNTKRLGGKQVLKIDKYKARLVVKGFKQKGVITLRLFLQ